MKPYEKLEKESDCLNDPRLRPIENKAMGFFLWREVLNFWLKKSPPFKAADELSRMDHIM